MQTERYIPQTTGAALVILEEGQIRVCELDARPNWKVGRYDPDMPNTPDILFSSNIVSREHGWIQNIDDEWYYVDNPKNLNGTFHNGVKITRPLNGMKRPVPLENGDILRMDHEDLDHVSSQGVLMLFTTNPIKGVWTAYPLGNGTVTIGRDSSCDIVQSLPYVSARHAQISFARGNYYLSDCDSNAGTYLNGNRVAGMALLREKDCISLCDSIFFFLGDMLLYTKQTREKERKSIFRIKPSERLAVLRTDKDARQAKKTRK